MDPVAHFVSGAVTSPGQCLGSMGVYVFSSEFLYAELEKDAASADSSHDFGHDIVPRLVAAQRRVAETNGCAFFDTYHAMGGENSIARWFQARPQLAAADSGVSLAR